LSRKKLWHPQRTKEILRLITVVYAQLHSRTLKHYDISKTKKKTVKKENHEVSNITKTHCKGSKAALNLMPLHCPPIHPPSTSSPFAASHCPRPHPPTLLYAQLEIASSCIRCKSYATNHTEVPVLPILVYIPPEEVAARAGEPRLTAALATDCHIPCLPATLVFTR